VCKERIEINQFSDVMLSMNNMKSTYNNRLIKEIYYRIGFIINNFLAKKLAMTVT